MTTSQDTCSKPKSEMADFRNQNTQALATNKIVIDYDEREYWEENKSPSMMKKIFSIDKMSLDLTNIKSDLQNIRNNEKCEKGNRLIKKNSSTILEKNDAPVEFDDLARQSFSADQRHGITGNDMFVSDASNMKKIAVEKYIEENPKSADFKWSLFCAACHSYRYDFVLRPFPPMFVKEDVKDIDRLRDVVESCPGINILHQQIQGTSTFLSIDLINLLYWVLIHVKAPQLKFIPKEKHGSILAKVVSSSAKTAPNYIFQLVHPRRSDQQKFNEYLKSYKTIHAFHGSRLDNFYSILNYGLRISFNKLSVNGPGIYLSSELNVSLPYSQSGFSWGASYFGSQISVVALCEMIDHPDVKYTDEKNTKKKSKFVVDFESVPQKYFVVTNGDLVRVKYLLVYSNSIPEVTGYQLSMITNWLQRNKVIAVVIAYIFLLLAIATSHSSTAYKFYRRIMRRFGYKI